MWSVLKSVGSVLVSSLCLVGNCLMGLLVYLGQVCVPHGSYRLLTGTTLQWGPSDFQLLAAFSLIKELEQASNLPFPPVSTPPYLVPPSLAHPRPLPLGSELHFLAFQSRVTK